jgi:hypothetical protein
LVRGTARRSRRAAAAKTFAERRSIEWRLTDGTRTL